MKSLNNSLRILTVEDNSSDLYLLQRMLRASGLKVE